MSTSKTSSPIAILEKPISDFEYCYSAAVVVETQSTFEDSTVDFVAAAVVVAVV